MDHLPPCCASCAELDQRARACRLLADPTPEHRARLLTLPCDAKRLIRQRFRAHSEEVVRSAAAVWEADTAASSIARDLEAPIDARAWATAWPVLALAGDLLRAHYPGSPRLGDRLPAPSGPIYDTLTQLLRIDPIGFALVVDGVRHGVDGPGWRAGLGIGDAAFDDLVALALLRALAIHSGVLARVALSPPGLCAQQRWFSAVGRSEVMALGRVRDGLGDPSLTMGQFRSLLGEGLDLLLSELKRDPTFSVVMGEPVERAFRNALGIGDQQAVDTDYTAPLFALLAREVADARPRSSEAHLAAIDLISAARGTAATPETPLSFIVEHLLCCLDDRCPALVRAEVIGSDAIARSLWAPLAAEVGSWPAPSPMLGPSTPNMIRCRDVLWEAFAGLSRAEGDEGGVDADVLQGMEHYSDLRHRLKNQPEAQTAPLEADDEVTEPRRP